jgi:diguanylate cyclase (GGDEF)-like protein/PAS domain S-box-containing protein
MWADHRQPLPRDEIEQLLTRLVDRLVKAITTVPLEERAVVEVASELVRHGLTDPHTIGHSIEILGNGLPRLPELHHLVHPDAAVLKALAVFARGYTGALRQQTVDEHTRAVDKAVAAAQRAKQEAELELRICETRFREIFFTSAVGIAISTFEGTVVTANRAFADIVGRNPADIIGASLPDLLQSHNDPALAEAYRKLSTGAESRFRHRRQLTAASGEIAWTHVGGSLLRGADKVPTHHLTVVENVTELHLLQQELSTQALHDVLTGLPNEQYLMSKLQEIVERADPAATITLCRMNLDRFSVITDGFGQEAGDALLRSVAHQLTELVTGQPAMVARLGADDFAILIEDGPDTPDPGELAASINEALCEPVYLNDRGLAVSAGVGVVRKPAGGSSPAELVRAANATLHHAKRIGQGQWDLYDAQADAQHRQRFQLAAEMPGGFESGEVKHRYQPVYELSRGWLVALQASLCWERADGTVVDHPECIALSELTGLVIELGRWMVQQACVVQHEVSRCPTSGAPLMRVDLTARLSQDPDLVAVVQDALSAADLAAGELRIGVPMTSLARGHGDVVDNVGVLADLGAQVVLVGAGAGLGYMAFLEDLPVGAVEITPEIVARIAQRPGTDSVVAQALRQAIPLVHSTGATVIVPGVDTAEQAQWWLDAGADLARGAHFGPPVRAQDLPELLTPAFFSRGR